MPAETIDIGADAFEAELRSGAGVLVVDTRDRAAFAAWHVDGADAPVLNVPEAELASDPDGALAAIPADACVRVICNAGNQSRRVAEALGPHTGEVRSVAGGLIGWSRVLQASEVPLGGPATVVQFRREARGCLSYLVVAGGEALVVDPAPDVQPYLDESGRLGARITRVLDTHVHADHLSGARELAARTGATLHLSHGAVRRGLRYADAIEPVGDGDAIPVGSVTATVVGLPGHTSDMIGVRLADEALIGGDSLFADSIARPDLEAGDEGMLDAAHILHRSLREQVGPLPGAMRLLPCHYAGGRLDGPVAPTLDQVRAAVPELALEADAFAERVIANMPPRPANYLEIIAVNMGEPYAPDAAARLEIGANNCAAKAEWACPS